MSESYDVIIIGSGIGGVAAGALLAHSGYKTLILEKNRLVGGRCSSYEKDGFIVDLGVHLFGVGDKGSLGDICRSVGMPNAIDWVTVDQPILQVGNKTEKYSRANMMGTVPEEESGNLGRLFMEIVQISEEEIESLWYVPLKDWISRFTTHPQVHLFFNMICGQYFCVGSAEASTTEFIRCFREVLTAKSSAYPRGGCVSIPKAYLAAVEKYGGRCITRAPVKKVIVDNNAAAGVRLEDGTEFRAPLIVANADIKSTVSDLVGEEHFPSDYVDRVKALTWSLHVIGLKVALNEKITDHQLVLYRPHGDGDGSDIEDKFYQAKLPDRVGGMITAPTNYDPSLAPPGHQMIFFGTACPAKADWKKWERVLLNSFYSVYPDAKGKVLWHRLDTPGIINAFAGETGNVIGVAQTVNQIHQLRPSVVSPLKGLYFASGEAGGHGIGTELAADSARELFRVLTKK